MERYDLVVIGGGPGGYPAAIRGSQLGKRVALVEGRELGGECTNFGCIPTKSMIRPVGFMHSLMRMEFVRGSLELNFEDYMSWVKAIRAKIAGGIRSLLSGYDIELFEQLASFRDERSVELQDGTVLGAEKIIVATGTEPAEPPGLEADGIVVHNNRTILELKRKPSRMLIVGSGYIGIEAAGVFAKMGVEVHLVEIMNRVLPGMEEDFSRLVARRLNRLGVKVYTSTSVKSIMRRESSAIVELSNGASIEPEIVLVAVGRRPNTSALKLERAKVETRNGYVSVGEDMRTSNPNVLASGDIAGPPLLAHKAFAQAIIAAENAFGANRSFKPRAIPSVIYFDPEIVSVGMTEEAARKELGNAFVTKLPIGGVARAVIDDSTDGFIKIVHDGKRILGIHMAAPHASEIAGEASLIVELGISLEDLANVIHPHPTMAEALQEAVELALGRPKHFIVKK